MLSPAIPGESTVQLPAISLSGNNANRTLWVGDVPHDWSEEDLSKVFAECSHPTYKTKRVFIKGELQGYCFVEFRNTDEARNTMYDLNGNRVPGTKGKVRFNLCFANDTYNPNSEFNIHVAGIPVDYSDAEFYRIFDKYYSCRGAKMFRFADGKSKGSGYVRFGDQTDQQMALVEMDRKKVDHQRISIKLAGPRGEKIDRFEKRDSYRNGGRDNGNGQRKSAPYSRGSYNNQQVFDAFGMPIQQKEQVQDLYNTDYPWKILPDENDLDPIIGLDLLPAKYRPQVTNKRYMVDPEQFMFDMESSRWSTVCFNINIKQEELEKQLSANQWTLPA
ncbi:unnamed protein product [Caenorhabditis angaria]|uniref:RRM domain-containing protein n=1 Tax=Caenorhabditis angaria TaxID=860376 RepID=A0A9P1N4I1_9PELO|nr:unnamed protein product [Caenorhabditis angaria]